MLIAGLFAGQHTSQVTSTWTALYLHRDENRDTFLRNVMEEQTELMREHGDTLNFDILNQMNNLHWSMKEVLRLHPPLVMLMRYARQPFKVKTRKGEEHTVPKGAIVATSPTMNHTLDYIFKEPDKFDPLRFGPGREEDKFAPFSFNGFGGGRHSCMGEHFGYMQVKTILSVLVRNFDIELVGDFPVPDFDSMVVGPKGACTARFRRRKLQVPPAAAEPAAEAAAPAEPAGRSE